MSKNKGKGHNIGRDLINNFNLPKPVAYSIALFFLIITIAIGWKIKKESNETAKEYHVIGVLRLNDEIPISNQRIFIKEFNKNVITDNNGEFEKSINIKSELSQLTFNVTYESYDTTIVKQIDYTDLNSIQLSIFPPPKSDEEKCIEGDIIACKKLRTYLRDLSIDSNKKYKELATIEPEKFALVHNSIGAYVGKTQQSMALIDMALNANREKERVCFDFGPGEKCDKSRDDFKVQFKRFITFYQINKEDIKKAYEFTIKE